jgi:trans-2,3-dihydro-3-hydroxyanthranilate isomerase
VPRHQVGVTRDLRIVDVFTDRPLAGNQLAVVLDGRGLTTELMQQITREMNFAETTFVLPPDDPTHAARVRIFTPGSELPFAGHPTIGTAWVLHDEGRTRGLEFVLEEGVGPVSVRGVPDGERIRFWMSHPPVVFGDMVEDRNKFATAIGLGIDDLVPDIPIQSATTGVPFLYAALRDPETVDRATRGVFGPPQQGMFIFAVAGPGHLYSRMFAGDALGIAEDPATGSASGPLGAFAVKYGLVARAPRVSLISEQGTKMGRQAFIHIELTYGESPDIPEKIEVGGGVMPVVKGTLDQ